MKKPTKRKMYQKRRKKEKEVQRKSEKTQLEQSQQNKLPPIKTTTNYKYNKKNNPKQYELNQNKNFSTYNNYNHESTNRTFNSYTQGLQIWWQTYCTAIQYHTEQQKRWNNESMPQGLIDNAGSYSELLSKYAQEYETSSEEEDDNEMKVHVCMQQTDQEDYFSEDPGTIGGVTAKADDVDVEYLKFLEITHKHREELRLKRAEENV